MYVKEFAILDITGVVNSTGLDITRITFIQHQWFTIALGPVIGFGLKLD